MQLYSYYRSSAAYRVRIALALKGITFETIPVDIAAGEQRGKYRDSNPQGLVPALKLEDGRLISQSTAIIEWLEETHPENPLLPSDSLARAQHRALCQHIACDIHPLNNLRVLHYLKDELHQEEKEIAKWYAHWIRSGFSSLEPAIQALNGAFSLNDKPGMLEIFLVPQLANARRFSVSVDDYPGILDLDRRCQAQHAFRIAHPDSQIDAPKA